MPPATQSSSVLSDGQSASVPVSRARDARTYFGAVEESDTLVRETLGAGERRGQWLGTVQEDSDFTPPHRAPADEVRLDQLMQTRGSQLEEGESEDSPSESEEDHSEADSVFAHKLVKKPSRAVAAPPLARAAVV